MDEVVLKLKKLRREIEAGARKPIVKIKLNGALLMYDILKAAEFTKEEIKEILGEIPTDLIE